MEVARNPSDANIKLWIAYLDKKNRLAERLKSRIAEFSGSTNQPSQNRLAQSRVQEIERSRSSFDPARFRVRTYFDSKCPHCMRMLSTLKELQEMGVLVEALQIDRDRSEQARFPLATTFADPADVKKQAIQSVPFTLVADLKNKTVLNPISGFKSLDEMKGVLSMFSKASN
jgi:glutaredoxin